MNKKAAPLLQGNYSEDRDKVLSYQKRGRLEPALAQAFLSKYPEDVQANVIVGEMLLTAGENFQAIAFYERAVTGSGFEPGYVDILTRLYLDHQFYENADKMLREAIRRHPQSATVFGNLGEFYSVLGRSDLAISHYRDALRLSHDNGYRQIVKRGLVEVLRASNRKDEALSVLAELQSAPGHKAYNAFTTADLTRANLESPVVQDILNLIDTSAGTIPPGDRTALLLGYGRAAEKSKNHDLAMESWQKARALNPAPYDAGEIESIVAKSVELYTKPLFDKTRGFANRSHAPVFVFGMPRSGTTLCEQILDAHPDCVGVGELGRMVVRGVPFIKKYGVPSGPGEIFANALKGKLVARGQEFLTVSSLVAKRPAKLVVDKTPTQFLAAGYIHLCLPYAKFINLMRHPADVFISTYQNHFTDTFSYAFNQVSFAHFYLHRAKILKHWRAVFGELILDLSYEELVSDPEPQVRRMLGFLGLDWDPACLRFHESGNAVRTFSRDQVRSGINNKSVGRWRNYEKHLGPLFEALGKAGYSYPESEI
ncbi:tetratricopeptide repeat-containing sulfotransferase family protein [Aestuariivirga litoralis]|uniref:tetratricopeptide repeat-containing sulfotransferase family protein n=1 Tax=Aestuariivirga litoralis TaxID=2650924 RepID=UPI0018C58878|nr:tetratricopeptide repeat-containing sulfotransferase family protein [Aestuariivirga litoralis]MBG1231677.1 tetratricopeptide repeat protein [Aestuariivirga litoralis]